MLLSARPDELPDRPVALPRGLVPPARRSSRRRSPPRGSTRAGRRSPPGLREGTSGEPAGSRPARTGCRSARRPAMRSRTPRADPPVPSRPPTSCWSRPSGTARISARSWRTSSRRSWTNGVGRRRPTGRDPPARGAHKRLPGRARLRGPRAARGLGAAARSGRGRGRRRGRGADEPGSRARAGRRELGDERDGRGRGGPRRARRGPEPQPRVLEQAFGSAAPRSACQYASSGIRTVVLASLSERGPGGTL